MATFYIDPSAASNGSGTVESPYNTWAGVTLTANNTYLQKRGTTYTGAAVRPISQSSSASTPLIIAAYYNADGSDDETKPKPIVNHNGGTNGVGAVFIDTCTNVVVRNIAGTASSAALGGAVTVRRSVGVLISKCVGYGNEHGFVITQDQASATSVCTDVTIEDCVAYSNVSTGICLRWGAVSTAVLSRIKLLRNRLYSNGTGKGFGSGGTSVPCAGIGSYTQSKASIGTTGFVSFDIQCEGNIVGPNNGYGINIEGFANSAWRSSVSRNEVFGSGQSLDVDSHSLWVGNSSGILIERNYVHDNYANSGASTGSGVGIFLDYNASSTSGGSNCVVRRNRIENQWLGATTATAKAASAGILVVYNTGSTVVSNVVSNCRNGIGASQGADTTLISGNTVIGSADSGYPVISGAVSTTVKNNVAKDCLVGLFVQSTGTTGYTESYNAVYGCTTNKANGTPSSPTATTLDASDLTVDPVLSSSWMPLLGSPLIAAGTHLGYASRDYAGKQRPNPPSIGAYDVATLRPSPMVDPA